MVHPGCSEQRQVPVAEVRPDSWVRRVPDAPKDDTVTLTKTQFQQILQVIGQVNVVNGEERVFNCEESDELKSSSHTQENGSNNSVPSKPNNEVSSCEILQKSPVRTSRVNVPCPLDVVISCPASLSWSTQAELSPSKLSPLSKIEQKRLQWQKEKAEMIEWNPWGKPGAGAPPKKTQIVAPITPRNHNNQLLMVQTSSAVPYSTSVSNGISSCITSPSHSRIFTGNLEQHSFIPSKSFINHTCVAQPVKPVPPVFKSSIAFGNTDNECISSDFYKRQQWLHELEYQKEEQRRLHEHMQMAPDGTWGNSNCKDEVESISVSVDGSILPGAADYHKRNYVRGQGFQLDPVSAALAEERRQKAQEYQHAIRLQMEEKQRRLEAERLRKKQEEEAEEKRLQDERAQIQAEYEEEQLRIKQKAEMEERKQQALISAVQQAQAQAEIERKSRKIQKLIPLPCENSDSQLSSQKTKEECSAPSSLPSDFDAKLKISGSSQHDSAAATKEPNSTKEADQNSIVGNRKDLGVQTVPVSDLEKSSCYVVDRVLTPSVFRVRAKASGHGKEFGTQTDIHYGKYATDGESTESNTSSFHNPIGRRVVRVQHSKPYKAQRRVQCSNIHSNERPKWGVNQPSKSYVRMTERDPHFSKRKRLQEIRKQHWARELAAQKASLSSSRRLVGNSYPCLRTRKTASSSDCTVGYSSSEFETRSCYHFRSNSTPRYQPPSGFHSDCGSAETIAYFNYSPSNHHHPRSVLHHRDSHSSDNLPSIIGGSEPSPSHHFQGLSRSNSSLPPMRRKWHSQETFYPVSNFHTFSPPHVPGVHPRILRENYRYELPPPHVPQRRKWSDQESFDLESVVRSKVVEESRPSSAQSSEKSQSQCASASSAGSSREKSASSQNPLVCPEVVTGRPTPRQDRILQNLSSLRQGLLKKQKELENLIRRPPPYLS